MSNYVNDLNDLITAKSEIKNIIQDTLNENPSEVFSYYPSYVARIAASSEGPYVVSYSYLSENYPDFAYLYAYVADAVESGGGSVDLSSYVTYSYAYETYPTYSYADNKYFGRLTGISGLSDGNVISNIGESFDAGASVRGIYFAKTYVPSYAYIESYYTTKSELSSAGYITSGDVAQMGYLTSSDLPVIDENLIPKETNTYTLGDASHLYAASYVADIWTGTKNKFSNRSDNQINLMLNNGWKYTFHSNGLSPATQSQDLGNGTPWRSTYTTNLYTDTAYLQDTSYSSSIVPKETNTYGLGSFDNPWAFTYSYQLNVGNNSKIYNDSGGVTVSINANNGVRFGTSAVYPKTSGGFSLGSSSNRWAYTYTNNLILNGTDIKDTINGMFSYDSTTGILTITSLT